jgi:hypothetical protein
MILNGWKEIARYVNGSVRTVQRWEKVGMPVVRPVPGSRGSVIAYSEQVDAWVGRSQLRREHLDTNGKSNISFSENFYDRLMQARSLIRQLMKTRTEMADRMLSLQAEIAALRENMLRMQIARNQYLSGQSMLSLPAVAGLNSAQLERDAQPKAEL